VAASGVDVADKDSRDEDADVELLKLRLEENRLLQKLHHATRVQRRRA